MVQLPWESGAAGDIGRRLSVWGAAGDLVIQSGEATASEKAQGAEEAFISGKARQPHSFFLPK